MIFEDEYSELMAKYLEFCPSKQACTQSKYFIETIFTTQPKKPNLMIEYKDPMVQYSTDYISYDILSLIGEVGGTLGLTIGLSFFNISELVIDFIKYITSIKV